MIRELFAALAAGIEGCRGLRGGTGAQWNLRAVPLEKFMLQMFSGCRRRRDASGSGAPCTGAVLAIQVGVAQPQRPRELPWTQLLCMAAARTPLASAFSPRPQRQCAPGSRARTRGRACAAARAGGPDADVVRPRLCAAARRSPLSALPPAASARPCEIRRQSEAGRCPITPRAAIWRPSAPLTAPDGLILQCASAGPTPYSLSPIALGCLRRAIFSPFFTYVASCSATTPPLRCTDTCRPKPRYLAFSASVLSNANASRLLRLLKSQHPHDAALHDLEAKSRIQYPAHCTGVHHRRGLFIARPAFTPAFHGRHAKHGQTPTPCLPVKRIPERIVYALVDPMA